ncbi:MAG: acetoacetate metabolism regulatory protein AtoC [Planctomycetota bacterium]|nr:MAG: acetoacetate metabolism regulatory protein AtoC [Planctomycetota bacterium]
MSTRRTVLVVEDEDYVRDSLVAVLENTDFACLAAPGVSAALELLGTHEVHAVLADLHMPEGGGLALLREIVEREWELPVVMITGAGTIEHAVEAMRGGAYDFVQKPVPPDQLVLLMQRALAHQRMGRDLAVLRERVRRAEALTELVGQSAALEALRAQIAQVAPSESTVLITGESGTGKELVAEMVHAGSPRSAGNLVRVNCAAIPEALFESEFFGQRGGVIPGVTSDRSGRFAEAEGGTLVLDEISALKPDMQAKLLRVLESGEYHVLGESRSRRADVRVVAVSNQDLSECVSEGSFRSDLYYRLAIFPLHTPPLRQLRDDLPAISAQLLAVSMHGVAPTQAAREASRLSPEALELLSSYDWPGNVRELRNLLERALIVSGGELPSVSVLGPLLEPVLAAAGPSRGDLHLRSRLEALEAEILSEALKKCAGVRKDAAALLGIDARNMGYYLRKHDLQDAAPRRDRDA